MDHDHLIVCTGIDQAFPMWDLICLHDNEDKFFVDNEGTRWDECLVQGWWDHECLDIVHSTDARYDNDPPGLAVITTYLDYGGEPLLRSRANAMDWKEGIDY